jgi:AcrR family transcriptional regulator
MPRGSDTREKIEMAAIDMFADRGLDGAAMRDIAAASGVTEPAVYRHFASKGDLVATLFTSHCRRLAKELENVRMGAPDLRCGLSAMIEVFCVLFDDRPALFRFLMMAHHGHLKPPQSEANAIGELLRRMVRDGIATSQLPAQNPGLGAALVLGVVVQAAGARLIGTLKGPLSAYAEDLAAAVWAALNRTVMDKEVPRAQSGLRQTRIRASRR